MAKDTVEAFKALGLKDINIYGVSMGGMTAMEIANYFDEQSRSEYYQYEGYGHAVYDLAPDFTERLLGFLNN